MGKKGDNGAHTRASAFLLKPVALSKLFSTFAKRYADRPGGYTRIHKFGNRQGDNAPHAILELVDNPRDLKMEMTSRALGMELLKEKLKSRSPQSITDFGLGKTANLVRAEQNLQAEDKGILRPMTRWNLQKVLRYRGQEGVRQISEKATQHAVRLCHVLSLSLLTSSSG